MVARYTGLVIALGAWLAATASAQDAWTAKWKYALDAAANAPTLYPNAQAPDSVIVAAGKAVVRLKGDGTVLWRSEQDSPTSSPATCADLDGDGAAEVLVALGDGSLVCLDQAGALKWRHAFPAATGGNKNIVVADILPSEGLEILCGWDDGWLNCLNAKGQLLWRFFGDRFRVGGICVGDADGDGVPDIIYGTDDGHIYNLTPAGLVKWRFYEEAPYGRSGPNLADLNGDGKCEVVITRSNVGNATCLIALDAATGTFLWRTRDAMQGYVSNAIVDLDADGKLEVIHADKGNFVYCENADGSRRWQVELGGRGIFWAPAVADIDGDGHLEVIATTRDNDPKDKASVFVVADDGKVKARITLGSGANAAPAVGDIDGDGKLEVVLAVEGPNELRVLTWNAAGKVAWPSLRGDSAMTGATLVAKKPADEKAAPAMTTSAVEPQSSPIKETGSANLSNAVAAWGDNTWKVSWNDAAAKEAFIELSALASSGVRETWIRPVKAGSTEASVDWTVQPLAQSLDVSVRLMASGKPEPQFATRKTVTPEMLGASALKLRGVSEKALQAGRLAEADVRNWTWMWRELDQEGDALREEVATAKESTGLAAKATEYRRRVESTVALGRALTKYWTDGGRESFVWWQDENPWDTFDPMAVPAEFSVKGGPVQVTGYGDEFEDVAITLLNVTSHAVDVRCTFSKPVLVDKPPTPEPPLAQHVTLRRGLRVGTCNRGVEVDALPPLDPSGVITLPPGEALQLWVVVDTHGLEPGKQTLPLYLSPIAAKPSVTEIPIEVNVWPLKLPVGVYSQINWSGCTPKDIPDQVLRDMLDHGITVFYGPSISLPLDAAGNSAGEPDWAPFDVALARLPGHCQILLPGAPALQWPQGVQVPETDPVYENGFKNAVRALAKHLAGIGWGYDRWAFYPIDEPWNTGDTEIPRLRRFCKMVKDADPQARNYTDPAGSVDTKKVAEFEPTIDVWQPEMNHLKRDPELLKWFQEKARTFWTYEAPGPGKDLLPLGHYRAFAWWAWMFGCKGSGYWVYRDSDIWWNRSCVDYGVVYPGPNGTVVPSRRWEASRDGNEDYRALYLLREAIAKARAEGKQPEADKAQELMDEAVQATVGWQLGSIDEITRFTRDYENDFATVQKYRQQIAQATAALQGVTFP